MLDARRPSMTHRLNDDCFLLGVVVRSPTDTNDGIPDGAQLDVFVGGNLKRTLRFVRESKGGPWRLGENIEVEV
jgi:hypothetical protein